MNKKITIQDLATSLSQNKGVTKKAAEAFIRTFFDTIVDNLQKDKLVKIKGMGTFKLSEMEERESVDVNTGERIVIKGYTKATFTPDATLRDEINKPFAQFETVILNENTILNDTETVNANEQTHEEEQNSIELYSINEKQVPELTEEPSHIASTTTKENDENIVEGKPLCDTESKSETPQEISFEKTSTSILPTSKQPSKEIQELDKVNKGITTPKTSEAANTLQEQGKNVKKVSEVATEQTETIENVSNKSHLDVTVRKNKKRNSTLCLFLLILIILGTAYFFFRNSNVNLITDPQTTVKVSEDIIEKPKEILADSTVQDTIFFVEEPQTIYPQMENGEYEIVGVIRTHSIKEGETLRTIAGKEYGSRDLSIYLIFFNKIENPDIVPVGLTIEIPELKLKQR